MANLSELRQKYPQYEDMSDQEFADKFHGKFYADMPKEKYYKKINFSPEQKKEEEPSSILEDIATKSGQVLPELASMAMSLPSEAYGAVTHPLQTLKNIPIGIAESGLGLVNIPGNISRYLGEKGYPTKTLSKILPHSDIGEVEKILGLEAKEPGESLVRGLSGFGALGKLGRFGEASNLGRAGIGATYAAGQEQNPLTGAVAGLIPGLIEKGKQGYQALREPGKVLAESEQALQDTKHLIEQQKEAGQAEKTDLSRFLNQVQEGLTGHQKGLVSQLPEIFPIKPKSETRSNLHNVTKEAVQNLSEDFDKRYADYEQNHGQTPIKKPFEWRDINLDNLPHVSITTKKMGYNTANDHLNYTNSQGENVNIKFPAENSSVQDYINFSRELRDAAWDASKAAKNATHGEAMGLRKTSNRLRQLQGDAEERIKDSVGEDAFNQFKQIQTDYSNLMGPVKTEPALFNAAYKKKISDKLHDTLLQPANEQIRMHLYENPDFVKAMREHLMQGSKHPLKSGALENPVEVNGDIQYLLSPEQKAAQAEQLRLHQAQQHLNEVSKNIKTPETLTTQQEQLIHGFHPRTSEHLSNEAMRRHIISQLERQQSEHTLTKQDKKRQINKRNAIIAATALPIGVWHGNKIAKFIKSLF